MKPSEIEFEILEVKKRQFLRDYINPPWFDKWKAKVKHDGHVFWYAFDIDRDNDSILSSIRWCIYFKFGYDTEDKMKQREVELKKAATLRGLRVKQVTEANP